MRTYTLAKVAFIRARSSSEAKGSDMAEDSESGGDQGDDVGGARLWWGIYVGGTVTNSLV